MSLNRMTTAAAEADEFLDGLMAPPPPEGTPDRGVVPEGSAPPEDQQAPAPDIDILKAESDRLKAQLADENNPTWKAKYATLQGMFNQLNREMKELKEELRQAPANNEPAVTPEPLMTSDTYKLLVDDVGKEVADVVKSLIERQAGSEGKLQEHLKPYAERIAKVEQAQAQTAGEQFFNTITMGCPDWKQINGWAAENIPQNPAFTAFIEQAIPGTDYTYDDLIQQYQQTGNARKIVEIFNLFKASLPKPAAPAPAQKPADINQYIDPNKTGKGSSLPDSTQPKTYSQAEVNRFYDAVVKGTFKGTLEEKTAMDAEYNKAIIEGRVT